MRSVLRYLNKYHGFICDFCAFYQSGFPSMIRTVVLAAVVTLNDPGRFEHGTAKSVLGVNRFYMAFQVIYTYFDIGIEIN